MIGDRLSVRPAGRETSWGGSEFVRLSEMFAETFSAPQERRSSSWNSSFVEHRNKAGLIFGDDGRLAEEEKPQKVWLCQKNRNTETFLKYQYSNVSIWTIKQFLMKVRNVSLSVFFAERRKQRGRKSVCGHQNQSSSSDDGWRSGAALISSEDPCWSTWICWLVWSTSSRSFL